MASKNVGTAGEIEVSGVVSASSAVGKYWDVLWAFYLHERVSSPSTFANDVAADVNVDGVREFAGYFSFDWGGGGLQSTLIASGTTRIFTTNGDARTITVQGVMGNTGTGGAGSGDSLSVSVSLPALKVAPAAPTACSATRNSDSSVTVSWTPGSSATNGQPSGYTVQRRVNGGSFSDAVTVSPTGSTSVSAAANQKLEYRVRAQNAAGQSSYSPTSTAIYTTPAAPTSVSAVKDSAGDITVSWTPHVGYSEHTHRVEHGTVSGGVTTWDGSPLATVAAGSSSYKHTSPNSGQVHVYRVYSRTSTGAALESSKVTSNSVQLLAAPNKPTVSTTPVYADKAATFRFSWAHNPVDSTAQTKYQYRYSTNGGSSWTTGSKTTSTNQYHDFAGSTWSANATVLFQVRTKGNYDSGSDGDASYSPWSDSASVTFKTKPVVTINDPADSSTYEQAELVVDLGFSQAESASFVRAEITLEDSSGVLEQKLTTSLVTAMDTPVRDGETYTLTVTVLDSNGLTSAAVQSEFDVAYTLPVTPDVQVSYLPDSGWAQLDLTFPTPGDDEVAAEFVSIIRTIDGVAETVYSRYPVSEAELSFLDTTPTINGTNTYQVIAESGDGAIVAAAGQLVTAEPYKAFLSTGPGYQEFISFFGDLEFGSAPARQQTLVHTAGRTKPIALFGPNRDLSVKGTATLLDDEGSGWRDVEQFILGAGLVCYRDPSGRRVFGALRASLPSIEHDIARFSFEVTEAS